jgi:hypothetical protein
MRQPANAAASGGALRHASSKSDSFWIVLGYYISCLQTGGNLTEAKLLLEFNLTIAKLRNREPVFPSDGSSGGAPRENETW